MTYLVIILLIKEFMKYAYPLLMNTIIAYFKELPFANPTVRNSTGHEAFHGEMLETSCRSAAALSHGHGLFRLSTDKPIRNVDFPCQVTELL